MAPSRNKTDAQIGRLECRHVIVFDAIQNHATLGESAAQRLHIATDRNYPSGMFEIRDFGDLVHHVVYNEIRD
jgi:hypothetical protein